MAKWHQLRLFSAPHIITLRKSMGSHVAIHSQLSASPGKMEPLRTTKHLCTCTSKNKLQEKQSGEVLVLTHT